MKDWLGNPLDVGDTVVYTSKSTNVGMVLGILTEITPNRMQIKPLKYSGHRTPAKVITLHSYQDAYKAVTKYNV